MPAGTKAEPFAGLIHRIEAGLPRRTKHTGFTAFSAPYRMAGNFFRQMGI